MPSDSQEPENYSISDMMDRLKERSSGDHANGELVTRADGTQAIKVKSRKRRSHQPHRETEQRSRRMRAVQIVGAVALVAVLGLLAGGVVVYMNGSAYRTKIMDRAGVVTGAKVESTQFRVTPIGANARTVAFEWPDSSPLKKLNLQDVAAELRFTSFFGQTWVGEEATAQKGELLVGVPNGDAGGDLADPAYFKFNRVRCSNLSMYFGDPHGPAMSILGGEMSLYPKGATGRPELRLSRGTVKFRKNFPDFTLDRGLIGVTGRQLDIVSLRLLETTGEHRGSMELNGQVESSASGRATTLDAKVKDLPLEYLMGPELGGILKGRIESRSVADSNFITFDPAKPDSQRVMIAFHGGFDNTMKLMQLPFLVQLRKIFSDSAYESLVLDGGATGILRINGSEVSLDNLRLEARSLTTIRGSMAVSAGNVLTGHLEVGLPASLVDKFPQLDAAFGSRKEELRWLDVTLSGTTSAPADDFNKRVVGQGGARSGGVGSAGGAASEFENLTRPR